ncbi:TrbM/KikA/MpfK family conjugal transfer protein [Neisseria sp.]|uniref:TrbM/KikA/MpfK family conjugal transfer protein n=1 Tax=Neisseria sp. TaxID=192066 RepID=UPI00359F520C
MKFLHIATILTFAISTPVSASETSIKFLTGDKKYACEALMCLATFGGSPSECSPALHRYFSIKFKYGSDTIRARKEFLRQCPMDDKQEKERMIHKFAR